MICSASAPPQPKNVSFVAANGASGTSLSSMPAHQAGDLLVAFIASTNASATLTPPAGWSSVGYNTATSKACRVAYKVAASSSETSGSWTGATSVTILSYRGAGVPGAWSSTTGTSAGSVAYPALSMNNTSGSSWVLRAGYAHNGTQSATMSGYTPRFAPSSSQRVYDSNGGLTSVPAGSASGTGTSTTYVTFSVEIPAGT